VTVVYSGVPGQPEDIEGAKYGWVSFPDGALVANEPEGASTWYPVNDIPTDKATYDFSITVPEGKTAIANGEQVGTPTTANGRTTYVWRETDPMASYLSTASIGDYAMTTDVGPD
jgi:aminopeptidase N